MQLLFSSLSMSFSVLNYLLRSSSACTLLGSCHLPSRTLRAYPRSSSAMLLVEAGAMAETNSRLEGGHWFRLHLMQDVFMSMFCL